MMRRTTFLLMFAAGCAAPSRLPTYALEDEALTAQTIRDRAAALKQLTGKGAVTLSSPSRGAVRLESVFVLAPPDRARIRAWKFNQAVFDLTVRSDGVWLYSPREGGDGAPGATGPAIRQWLGYLAAGVPAGSATSEIDGRTLLLTSDDPKVPGAVLTTTIDRPTRTVRSYRLVDAGGTERFTLTLDRYRDFAGTLWPTRIIARSATGTIVIETDDLQPDVAAEAAFTAPARAARLP